MFELSEWASPPEDLALEPASVHLWRVPLQGWPLADLDALFVTLAADEQLRAGRFHFRRDRDSFVVARGVLRSLLARYLDALPADIRFAYSPYGKPALDWPGSELRFNLSHSHQLALVAVAQGRDLGVDLEHRVPERATMAVARQCFGDDELAALASLPAEQWAEGFYNGWTRKEALIKARGEGLSLPLTQIAVSLLPGEPARLLRSTDPADLRRWSLHALDPGPGYAAALAVEGQPPSLSYLAYEP